MPAEDPKAIAARLLDALEGLDLTSADGRAGLHTLLSEIERARPGAILRQAAPRVKAYATRLSRAALAA